VIRSLFLFSFFFDPPFFSPSVIEVSKGRNPSFSSPFPAERKREARNPLGSLPFEAKTERSFLQQVTSPWFFLLPTGKGGWKTVRDSPFGPLPSQRGVPPPSGALLMSGRLFFSFFFTFSGPTEAVPAPSSSPFFPFSSFLFLDNELRVPFLSLLLTLFFFKAAGRPRPPCSFPWPDYIGGAQLPFFFSPPFFFPRDVQIVWLRLAGTMRRDFDTVRSFFSLFSPSPISPFFFPGPGDGAARWERVFFLTALPFDDSSATEDSKRFALFFPLSLFFPERFLLSFPSLFSFLLPFIRKIQGGRGRRGKGRRAVGFRYPFPPSSPSSFLEKGPTSFS